VGVLDGLTVIQHRLSIFQGFIECERDGYVKAGIAGLTNTLRFKHRKPLVNLPGVDKPWGKEVRACLIADEGYVLCGADMTSLEDTTKRHYMKPLDPDYVDEMAREGFDPHLDLAKHAGAVTQAQIDKHNSGEVSLKSLRKNYKVVNYSATYGVGPAKLSRTTGMPIPQAASLLAAYWKRNWSVKAFSESQVIRKIDGEMWVQNPVSKFWHSLRYEKDVFSTLNQSTGAYCFDKWVAYYRTKSPNILGQFHDESINQVRKGSEQEHSSILQWAIGKVNQELKLNVDLGIDVQYGTTYSEIH
jgi:DNA polymerase I-like protein with 3'-5' exonuclease and polymerase domains